MTIVELRVHGVHGTAPASMLGVEARDVRQVAGDNLTGVYRSTSGELPYRDLSRPLPEGRRVSVEAYSWGALTSGVRGALGWLQRALWLLLFPFALANLAYWARLHLDGSEPAGRWGLRATRLGALLLTVFLLLIPALIGIDLIAWQCYRGDSPGCAPLPGFFDFLADLRPGQRLAVGSALPLGFVALLWFLSRQSLLRYEEVTYDDGADRPTRLVLRHPSLWRGKQRTQELQRLHLAVALAVVVVFSGAHVWVMPGADDRWVRLAVGVAAGVSVLVALLLCAIHPDDIERPGLQEVPLYGVRRRLGLGVGTERRLRDRATRGFLVVMIATTVAHLVALWQLGGELDQRPDFFGHNMWFIGVFVALSAVHMAVFTGDRMARPGAIASVIAVLALAAGALLVHLIPPARPDGQEPPGWQAALPAKEELGWAVLAAAALLYLVLSLWHGNECVRHRRVAWNGAGASVLLASAGWVALLFTTGAVTATANWLNGGERGVADLVSHLGDAPPEATRTVVAVNAVPFGYQEGRITTSRAALELQGDTVVRDAVVTVTQDGPFLTSGTVETDRVYATPGRRPDPGEQSVQKGRLQIGAGRLLLEDDVVRLEDSCVRYGSGEECRAEGTGFLAGSQLQLDAAVLEVRSQSDDVVIDPREAPAVPLVVPQVLIWAPLVQTVWLALAAAWVGFAWWRFRRARPAIDRLVVADGIAARDRDAARKARRTAAFAHRAERVVDGVGSITAVLIIALIAFSSTGRPPAEWVPRAVQDIGMYVALAMGLGLVLLLSRLRRSEDTRKAVGVLWDLSTFWPRAAHPLAPPCYAERVVPELRSRIDWALHHHKDGQDVRADNLVVLSGHSQGSAIACAVLSRLPRGDLARVRVITYGSQIRALYGRVFPAVFGPDQIGYAPTPGPTELGDAFPDVPGDARPPDPPGCRVTGVPSIAARPRTAGHPHDEPLAHRLFAAGGSWVNLFRRSDPLGYRVFSDRDVLPDRYVPEVPDVVVGDPGPAVNTHGGYQHTYAYRQVVAGWTREEALEDPASTTDLPALP